MRWAAAEAPPAWPRLPLSPLLKDGVKSPQSLATASIAAISCRVPDIDKRGRGRKEPRRHRVGAKVSVCCPEMSPPAQTADALSYPLSLPSPTEHIAYNLTLTHVSSIPHSPPGFSSKQSQGKKEKTVARNDTRLLLAVSLCPSGVTVLCSPPECSAY